MDRSAFLRAIAAAPVMSAPAATATRETPGSPARSEAPATSEVPASMRTPGGAVAAYGSPDRAERDIVREPPGATELAFTPLAHQVGTITPSGLWFTRNHAGVPRIDPARHRLVVHGLVERPIVFTLADVMRFPSVSRTHFIECAGNGAAEWQGPTARTVTQSHGLVSCAQWTGVPLRAILERAKPAADAAWVLAEGADAAAYDRSIPFAKAFDDALLAYGQNGEMLRPEQGYPLRLVLPGYEGSTHVKWLRRLKVGRAPWYTREETAEYTELLPDGRARAFAFVQDAKSVITTPSPGERLPAHGSYELRGFAWSGRGRIRSVEVSFDGGATWTLALLQDPVLERSFTRFTLPFAWNGRAALLQSRATDETGYVQPTHRALVAARGYFSTYHNNAIATWRLASDGTVTDAPA